MSDTHTYQIELSLWADPISKQLRKQKIEFDAKKVKVIEGHLLAIKRLHVHSLLTDKEEQKAMARLGTKLKKYIREFTVEA